MNKTLLSTVLIGLCTLTACENESQMTEESKEVSITYFSSDGETGEKPQEEAPAKEYPSHPLTGLLFNQPFTPDRFSFIDNILELSVGDASAKSQFSDLSIKIHLFDTKGFDSREMVFDDTSGQMKPPLTLSWLKNKTDTRPHTETVATGYSLSIKFGAFNDGSLGVPVSLELAIPKHDTTITGSSIAVYRDIRLIDGQVDNTLDTPDTIRHIALDYLIKQHGSHAVEINHVFGVRITGSKASSYKWGFVGFEADINSEPQIAKLQLFKDDNGWRVVNQLSPDELHHANPVFVEKHEGGSELDTVLAIQAAAVYLQNEFVASKMIASVRGMDFKCDFIQDKSKATCRSTYVSSADNRCKTRNLLIQRYEDHWDVDANLPDNQILNYMTGHVIKTGSPTIACLK